MEAITLSRRTKVIGPSHFSLPKFLLPVLQSISTKSAQSNHDCHSITQWRVALIPQSFSQPQRGCPLSLALGDRGWKRPEPYTRRFKTKSLLLECNQKLSTAPDASSAAPQSATSQKLLDQHPSPSTRARSPSVLSENRSIKTSTNRGNSYPHDNSARQPGE